MTDVIGFYPCELSAGRQHDDNPPDAVAEVILEWDTRAGEPMRSVKKLCGACYEDKAEEFAEHARDASHSLLIVSQRYTRNAAGVKRPGSRIGRADPTFSARLGRARKQDAL